VVYVLSLLFLCLDDTERRQMNQLWGEFYSKVRAYKPEEVIVRSAGQTRRLTSVHRRDY